MLEKLFHKKNLLLIIFITFLFGTVFFYIIFAQINEHHKDSHGQQERLLLNESISLFEIMTYARQWSAEHGGVYVKKHDDLAPNPYLKDNILKVDDNTTLIKINPAWMTRQMSELMNKESSRYYRITSLKPINPDNAPDEFEKEALEYFEIHPNEKYYFKNDMNTFSKSKLSKEKSVMMYNFMGRLETTKACLTCHAVQGYKIGDTRGGIRVSIPVDKYQKAMLVEDERRISSIYFVVILIVIISALLFTVIYIFLREQKKLQELNETLENRVIDRTKSLNELNENLEQKVAIEVAKSKDKDNLIIAQSRQAAMGEMISMIAHQWRQPLSTIAMDASNMIVDIQLDDFNKDIFLEYSAGIIEQTEHLSKTIDDFRNFFRQEKEKVCLPPSKVIYECFEMVGASLKAHGIEYEIVCESEKAVEMHSRELLQVILNLVNNSKDVLIERKTKDPQIIITINQLDNTTIINVCDNGAGIPEDILPRIFEPYFTTKEKKNGTGLGLYMSKMIIETNFNGSITVSTGESGTCFSIQFDSN